MTIVLKVLNIAAVAEEGSGFESSASGVLTFRLRSLGVLALSCARWLSSHDYQVYTSDASAGSARLFVSGSCFFFFLMMLHYDSRMKMCIILERSGWYLFYSVVNIVRFASKLWSETTQSILSNFGKQRILLNKK